MARSSAEGRSRLHTKCSCGGIYRRHHELGIKPRIIFMDKGEAWYAKDADICDACGAHWVYGDREKIFN